MTTPTRTPVVDASLLRGLKGIALAGLFVAALFGLGMGLVGAKSALVGAAMAALNLLGIAFVIRGSLEGSAFASLLGLGKIAVLFGATYVLVSADVVRALPLAFGYACLPLGLTLGLALPQDAEDEPKTPSESASSQSPRSPSPPSPSSPPNASEPPDDPA
jgi:hypothetical protein